MLLEFDKMAEDEMLRLVQDIYPEGCEENARWRYPDKEELTEAIREEEQGFVEFLKTFLAEERNRYYVLEINGQWVSALRLTKFEDFYYLEALETAPKHRKQGYGAQLINEVTELIRKRGPVTIRDNVSKRNVPSLATHKKCGFVIEEENGMDYLSGQRCDRVYGMIFKTNESRANEN